MKKYLTKENLILWYIVISTMIIIALLFGFLARGALMDELALEAEKANEIGIIVEAKKTAEEAKKIYEENTWKARCNEARLAEKITGTWVTIDCTKDLNKWASYNTVK